MASRSSSNLSLDFSDVPFDEHRTYGIKDWIPGHLLDADVRSQFLFYAENCPAPIFGEAFLITSISSEYDLDAMDTTYTIVLMDTDGAISSHLISLWNIRKIHTRRSIRMYGEMR